MNVFHFNSEHLKQDKELQPDSFLWRSQTKKKSKKSLGTTGLIFNNVFYELIHMFF